MDQPMGVMGTPGLNIFSLIIIGGLAGWIGGMTVGARHGMLTNILVGIVGSWLGSELASNVFHFAIYGTIRHFLAALVGSIIVLVVWQAIQGRNLPQR